MVRYYCPDCWGEFWEKLDNCPDCGQSLDDYGKKDYTEKLLNALNHKVGDIRHRAVMILALKKEKSALPHLKDIVQSSIDPSLVRAARDAIERIEVSDYWNG